MTLHQIPESKFYINPDTAFYNPDEYLAFATKKLMNKTNNQTMFDLISSCIWYSYKQAVYQNKE